MIIHRLSAAFDTSQPLAMHYLWHRQGNQYGDLGVTIMDHLSRGGSNLGGTVPPKIWGGGRPMHLIFWEAVLSDARESTNRVKKGVVKEIGIFSEKM